MTSTEALAALRARHVRSHGDADPMCMPGCLVADALALVAQVVAENATLRAELAAKEEAARRTTLEMAVDHAAKVEELRAETAGVVRAAREMDEEVTGEMYDEVADDGSTVPRPQYVPSRETWQALRAALAPFPSESGEP